MTAIKMMGTQLEQFKALQPDLYKRQVVEEQGDFAQVVRNGKVIATVDNFGNVQTDAIYRKRIENETQNIKGEGPQLAQAKAEKIAASFEGNVNVLETAKTQDAWNNREIDWKVDFEMMARHGYDVPQSTAVNVFDTLEMAQDTIMAILNTQNPDIMLTEVENTQGLATLYQVGGNAPVASAGILSEEITGVLPVYTQLETHIASYDFPEYMDIVNDPESYVEAYKNDYDTFLQNAQNVVDELKKMDTYGVIDISFSATGSVTTSFNEKFNQLSGRVGSDGASAVSKAMQNRDDIMKWVTQNTESLHAMAEKAEYYAYAKSVVDYRDTVGVSRENLNLEAEYDEYALRITRYAHNTFGINMLDYHEADEKFGVPAFTYVDGTVDGTNKPIARLPNMPA